jgi:hypothetical protein
MKKNLLLITAALGTALGATAQGVWVPQDVKIAKPATSTAPIKLATDVKVVDRDNVWAWFRSSAQATILRQYSYTTNGGATWKGKVLSATGVTITNLEIANMSVLDSNTAFASLYPPAASLTNQGIYKTTNGGTTWTKSTTGKFTGGTSFVNWVHFWDANKGVCMGDPINNAFEIYTTIDGGTTWTLRADTIANPALKPGDADEFGIVNLFDAQPNGLIWFGTNHGRVLKSTDYGVTWTDAASGFATTGKTTQAFSTLKFKDANTGVVVNSIVVGTGTAAKVDSVAVTETMDGGATWIVKQFTGQWNPSDVCYVPGTNKMISVGDQNVTASKFPFKTGSTISNNGGASFGYQDSVSFLRTVSFFNDSVGYAGGPISFNLNAGVYKWYKNGAPNKLNNSIVAVNNTISLSPNPANNFVNVVIPSKKAQIAVYNMLGEVVYTTNIYDGRCTLDISSYTTGAYVVQVIDGKLNYTKKFIKE